MKKTLFFAVTICLGGFSFAYPITPRPLRKLVIESEYIVWAYVADIGTIKQTKKNEHLWDRNYATVIVNEVLQGKPESDTLRVYFNSGMICPAPGVFYKGEQVLAFLDKRKNMDGYEVHALSYDVKQALSAQECATYKTRIKEMQQLLKEDETEDQTRKITDWLVKCAEQRCTRWEGTYELSPRNHFMSYYDRDGINGKAFSPDQKQRQRLFNTLLAVDTMNYEDIALADLTMGLDDSLLLDCLKTQLTRVRQENLWPAQFIMEKIVKLTGNSELENLQEKFSKASFDYSDKEQKQAKEFLSEFIFKMKDAVLKRIIYASGMFNT